MNLFYTNLLTLFFVIGVHSYTKYNSNNPCSNKLSIESYNECKKNKIEKEKNNALYFMLFFIGIIFMIVAWALIKSRKASSSSHEAFLDLRQRTETYMRQNAESLPNYNDVVNVTVPPIYTPNNETSSSLQNNHDVHLPTYKETMNNGIK